MHLWCSHKKMKPLHTAKKSHFAARNKMLPTTWGRMTGLNLSEKKTKLMNHSLFLLSHPLLFFFSCSSRGQPLLWAGCDAFHDMLVVHELWLRSERNQQALLATDCVLLNQSLSAFFGELVKYNCVILYKAVAGWQLPEKLHYSVFYWCMKKKKEKKREKSEHLWCDE